MNETYIVLDKTLQLALYSSVGFVSLVANIAIVVVILSKKSMRVFGNFLLVNLAASDLLSILFGIPQTLNNLIEDKKDEVPNGLCMALGLMMFTTFVASVFNLTMIAVHRYILINRYSSYHLFKRKVIAIPFILIPWLLSFLIGFPPILGWGQYSYDQNRAHCMTEWGYSLSYLIFIQIMAYPVPLFTLIYAYYQILKSTKESRKRVTKTGGRINSTAKNRELKLTKMLVAIVVCFFVCFTPYAALIQLEGIFKLKTKPVFSLVAMLCAYSNSILDFWIYSIMNPKFRTALAGQMFSGFSSFNGSQDQPPKLRFHLTSSGKQSSDSNIEIPKCPKNRTETDNKNKRELNNVRVENASAK